MQVCGKAWGRIIAVPPLILSTDNEPPVGDGHRMNTLLKTTNQILPTPASSPIVVTSYSLRTTACELVHYLNQSDLVSNRNLVNCNYKCI